MPDGRFVALWPDVGPPGVTIRLNVYGQIFGSRTAAVTFTGTDGDDDYIGSRFADTLRGGLGDDSLRGEDGSDLPYGGADNDSLEGGAVMMSCMMACR
ncbi:hypothetical protein AA309_22615 [Microvirga vignae]|uniref:Uncharacterized protein n=1 Tax=Microvirga vignae TaxID=1225564 RepID=A0A0H1R755_9HYPH|nr:hypothetical protein [Microvirga vignae]KLK90978.1 hypothetical protein AA309_22615 [Microvirga vignae]